MTPTMLPLASITDSHNARRTAAGAHDDALLLASIRAIGLLQPVLVTPNGTPDTYTLIAGHRRFAAVTELGWEEIPAMVIGEGDDAATPAIAMSAAENMVRMPMHPIDTWRAIGALIEAGFTSDGAATALGLTPRYAQRLDKLSRLAPEIIDTLATARELPADSYLRTIALAPIEVQQKAIAGALRRRGKREELDWWAVSRDCQVARIPASRAIFSTAPAENNGAGVVFDEDLFAEPGSDDQFTTTDVKGFLAAQRTALVEQAAASKGRIEVSSFLQDGYTVALPTGWLPTYDPLPKRWKKDDPRRAFAAVHQVGHSIGSVQYVVARPKPKPATKPANDTDGSTAADTETPARERPPITKAALQRMAALKSEAVRETLPGFASEHGSGTMLQALLLMLSAANVSLPDTLHRYGKGPYKHLARALVDDNGWPLPLDDAELRTLAADTIARMVKFEAPDWFDSSGNAAEYLARLIDAKMPRCDTAEILRGFTGEKLTAIAEAAGIDTSGTVSALRARLVGNLPDWRPVDFGAAGPEAPDDDDIEDIHEDSGDGEVEQEDAA
jgi:ParB/RepB/Spo0J family partition protein